MKSRILWSLILCIVIAWTISLISPREKVTRTTQRDRTDGVYVASSGPASGAETKVSWRGLMPVDAPRNNARPPGIAQPAGRVLRERIVSETSDPSSPRRRERLMEVEGKYPRIAIEEWLSDDPARPVERRVAMVADHVVVALEPGVSAEQLEAVARMHGGQIRRQLRGPENTFLVEIAGAGVEEVRAAMHTYLQQQGLVRRAEPDYILTTMLQPDDPQFNSLWGMNNTGQTTAGYSTGGTVDADIDAPEAWQYTTGSLEVVVGVIDTGIDASHPDLSANMWTNPGETGLDENGIGRQTNGVDDDANGYIDDWQGWDFVNGDNNPDDDNFHGTHCAGTIGAIGNNAIGVAGVNWRVSLVGLKFLNGGGSGYLSDGVEAIYYATSLGVDLTSNSWGGGGYSESMREAIADANANGILFIAAAGNDSRNNNIDPSYPGSYDEPNVISVAATDHNDVLAAFSNYGSNSVHLAAPGVNIASTIPLAKAAQLGYADPYGVISGTSMACPHVAGAAALLKAWVPSMPHLEMRDRLLSKVDAKPLLAGKLITGGRLNVHAALDGVSETPSFVIERVAFDDSSSGNGDGVLNPGESATVRVDIFNLGYIAASNVTASITTTNIQVSITDGSATYGQAAPRAATTPTDGFVLAVATNAPTPLAVNCVLTLSDDQGRTWELPFTLGVYNSYLLAGVARLDAAPLAGAVVSADGPVPGVVTTAPDGTFAITVGDGDYEIIARYGDSATAITEVQLVTVAPAATNLVFDFTTAVFAGQLTHLQNQPLAGALVRYSGPVTGVLTTDATGQYGTTNIYGRSVTWTLDASKYDLYPFPPVRRVVTLPPDALDVDIAFSPPSIGFDPISLVVDALLGESPTRTVVITNRGTIRLDWSSVALTSSTGTVGSLSYDFATTALSGNGYGRGTASDGTHLYEMGQDFNLFVRNLTNGALVTSYNMPNHILGFNSNWRLGSWDGRDLWFHEQVVDPADPSRSTYTMHAVDLQNRLIKRSMSIDPQLYGFSGSGGAFVSSSTVAFGENSFWFMWRKYNTELAANEDFIVRIDRYTGARLQIYPFPSGVSLNSFLLQNGLTYSGGALWMVDNAFNNLYGPPRIYKVNPFTGSLILSVALPAGQIVGLAADGKGLLWTRIRSVNRLRAYTTGETIWFTSSPTLGEVDGSTTSELTLNFNSTLAGLGVHTGTLRIDSSDPPRPTAYLPVVFRVHDGSATNQSPRVVTATPEPDVLMQETGSQAFSVHAVDDDGDALSYTWMRDGQVQPGITGTNWTYTTSFGDDGSHAIAVVIRDGKGGVAQAAWQVTVANLNRVPTVTPQSLEVANDETLPITLTGSDPDGEPLTFLVVTPPAHGTLSGQAPNFIYTPASNYAGSDSLVFKATDGLDESAPASVNIQVKFRDISVSTNALFVNAIYGTIVTQRLTVINQGDYRVQWSMPMEALTPPLNAGITGELILSLPSVSSVMRSGLAYDGTNFWIGNHDYTNQNTRLLKISATNGALLANAPLPGQGTWSARLSRDASNRLWSLSADWINNPSLPGFIRRLNITNNTASVALQIPIYNPEFQFVHGIAAAWDRIWVARSDVFNSGSGFFKGGMHQFDPVTGQGSLAWTYPGDVTGGAIDMWNGALWMADIDGGRMLKLNPFTGATLGSFELDVFYRMNDIASDGSGNFYFLQVNDPVKADLIGRITSGDYLRMTPDWGVAEGSSTTEVTVVFDTLTAGYGQHEAVIHLLSTDKSKPDIEIPVTFTVTPEAGNEPPVITNMTPATSCVVTARQLQVFTVQATDADGDPLTYRWTLNGELMDVNTNHWFEWIFRADTVTNYTLGITVDDLRGGVVSQAWSIAVAIPPLSAQAFVQPAAAHVAFPVAFHARLDGGTNTTGPFVDVSGTTVMEAENYQHRSGENGNFFWSRVSGFWNPAGGALMATETFGDIAQWSDAVELAYDIQVKTSGAYAIWMRVKGQLEIENSAWVGVNGAQLGGAFDDEGVDSDWNWVRHPVTTNISAGWNTVNLRIREDDYYIDRVVLTRDEAFSPQGKGPLWESPRVANATYRWYFGDGSPVRAQAAPSHTYATAGTYTARVEVTAGGIVVTSTVHVVVTELDTDQDGIPDRLESIAGTDPSNPASVLRVETAPVPGGASESLGFMAVTGRWYTFEYRTNIMTGGWEPFFPFVDIPGDDGVIEMTVTNIPESYYFRLRVTDTPPGNP